MKILFVYTLTYYRLRKKPVVANSIQLGISYISSLLKKYGHKTELLVLSRFFGKKNKELLDKYIKDFSPALVCFTTVASEYPFVAEVASYIKSFYPDIYLLAGGPHVSLNPEVALPDAFDALCIGEGEYPVFELVTQLESGRKPSGIQNFWIKSDKGVEKNMARPYLENLDILPFPDREIWEDWVDQKRAVYSVLLGRGCPFQCTYCCNHALQKLTTGNYVRFRSPENIVAEIKDMLSGLSINNEIYLEVETIAVNKEWAIKLCSKLEDFNSTLSCPIAFGVNIRVTPNADLKELFVAMKKCNVRFVNIGLESGCERVRSKILKRNYSNEDIFKTVKLAREYGFKVCFFNLIGIPGESIEDFKETVQINRRCLPDWHNTSIFFPYPGTDLHRICTQQGLIKKELNNNLERRQASLDLPGFPKKEINKSFIRFDYYVYRGYRPLYKILMRVFILKVKSIIGFLLLAAKATSWPKPVLLKPPK